MLQQIIGFAHRDIPEQLGPLAEYRADITGVLLAFMVWDDAVDSYAAFARGQDAAQHFDRGRLARPVRAYVTDQFTLID
ncbi:hypothetical protein D3C73_1520270 [compost metagenome]